MRIKNLELWIALSLIILISFGYLQTAARTAIPEASGLIGHTLGVIGTVLMLMTEILYSLRKRYQFARWGKLQNWLSFHVITGLVGPYLVLLHSSWKFNGLAGILMLLTVIIVISGFIGRYFYTAVPRSVDGTVLEAEEIAALIKKTKKSLADLEQSRPEEYQLAHHNIAERRYKKKSTRRKIRFQRELKSSIMSEDELLLEKLSSLLERQEALSLQLKKLEGSRRLLAIWHTLHVPIGIGLFSIAFIHVLATLYYATLLH